MAHGTSRWLSVAGVAALCIGVLLTGCDAQGHPGPAVTTADQKLDQTGKNVTDELSELGKILTNPNLSPQDRASQVGAKAKQYYCTAENSQAADFLKTGIEKLYNQLASDNPGAKIPPLNLSSDSCK